MGSITHNIKPISLEDMADEQTVVDATDIKEQIIVNETIEPAKTE